MMHLLPTRGSAASRILAAFAVLAFVAARPAAAAPGPAPDVFWELLGDDASPDAWTTVYEDDKPDRPLPREGFRRVLSVAHQPIGEDRQLLRFAFSGPLDLEQQSLTIYLDVDADATTGRGDGENAGAEEQAALSQNQGEVRYESFLYEHDGFRRPGNLAWIGVVGDAAYAVFDDTVAQEAGRSRFGLGWLTQVKDSSGQTLAAEKSARTLVTSRAGEGLAERPSALPRPSAGPEKPEELDGVRLYTLPEGRDAAAVHARLSWVGPVRVHHGATRSLGQTTPLTLANHLHRVELPASGGGPSRFAKVEALTPDWRWVESEVVELEELGQVTAGAGGGPVRVPMLSTNPTEKPLKAYPQRVGVPFARGVLTDPARLGVQNPAGELIAADFHVSSRWPDGSVRWLRVDHAADLPAGGEVTHTLVDRGSEAPASPLRIEEDARGWSVDTGPLRFRVEREPLAVFQGVTANGRDLGDLGLSGVMVGDDGESYRMDAGLREAEIEQDGDAAAVLRLSGVHVNDAGDELNSWSLRLRVTAGSPLVEVEHVFGTTDLREEMTSFKSLNLEFAAGGDAPERDVFQWIDNEYRLSERGGKAREVDGQWEQPFDLGRGVTVAVRDFWQNYPKRVSVADGRARLGIAPDISDDPYAAFPDLEDRLFLSLRGGKYTYIRGFERRHTLLCDFGGGATPSVDTLARCEPDLYASSGAVGPMLTADELPPSLADYPGYIRGALDRYLDDRREKRAYGLMNYGDWFGERRYNWGNNEYDTAYGLLSHHAMLGDPDFLREGSLIAEHLADVDTRHVGKDPREAGSVYIHTVGHTGGYFGDDWRQLQSARAPGAFAAPDIQNWGHYWGEGLMLHHAMRGDPRSLETLKDIAYRVSTHYVNGPAHAWRNPRQQGWVLKVPIAAYKATGDPFYLLSAETMVGILLDRQDDSGGWSVLLADAAASPDRQSFGSTNFPIGIVLSSFARCHEVTDDPVTESALVRGVRWLIEDLWEPEEPLGFRYSSGPHSTGGTRFYHINYPVAYAWGLTHERTFHDVAIEYTRRYLTESIKKTHEYGKPFSQHLREAVHTLPLLAEMLDTPHEGVVAEGSSIRWVIRPESDRKASVRVTRSSGSGGAALRVETLGGEVLQRWRFEGGESVAEEDLSKLPGGQLLNLVLEPEVPSAAWSAAVLRGQQMLDLSTAAALGVGVEKPSLRFGVPKEQRSVTLELGVPGGGERTVRLFDPNGEPLATLELSGPGPHRETVDLPVFWPVLAGASYRGPLRHSDLQHRVEADGPFSLRLPDSADAPGWVTPSAVAFFPTSQPQVFVAGDRSLDLGEGPLRLDASASGVVSGAELQFSWDLGDGTTQTGPVVDGHRYAEAGSYPVRLRVDAPGGASVTEAFDVKVAPPFLLEPDAAGRVFINAPDYTAHSGPDLVKAERINSIGQMVTYWESEQMNKVRWPFRIDRAGEYTLTVKFCNNSTVDSGRRFWVNGEDVDPALRDVSFPPTGGWSRFSDNWQWKTLSDASGEPIRFDLSKGEHTLEVGNTREGLGVDYYVFTRVD